MACVYLHAYLMELAEIDVSCVLLLELGPASTSNASAALLLNVRMPSRALSG